VRGLAARGARSREVSGEAREEQAAKPASASACTMTELVLPQHSNALGTIFGGTVMSWVDLCGAICAQRHSGRQVVTAFVDDLLFEGPVRVGQVARLAARINATFRTSMEVEVVVEGEDAPSGKTWPCVRAVLTFVALDEAGKPTAVPPLAIEGEDDERRKREAEERRSLRLRRSRSRG
jgi:acyl-CoA hydrolase